jgi:NADH-quinone oxidoreductase subunit N
MPLTAGFVGKLVLFLGALAVPGNALSAASLSQVRLFRILALIGAINAAIGAVYYLRIIALMYLRSALRPLEPRRAVPGLAALGICVVVTLVAGIYPQALWLPVQSAIPRPVTQVMRPV